MCKVMDAHRRASARRASLLFPPDAFMVITFAVLFCCADGSLLLWDTNHCRAALQSRGMVSWKSFEMYEITVPICTHMSLVFGDEFLAQCLHLKSHQRRSAGIRTWLSADQSSSSTLTES